MKVLVQWTQSDPQDWVEIDAADWAKLPTHPEPKGPRENFTGNEPGYVFDLNVQGVHFGGHDHYFVEPYMGDGCHVIIWDDDPEEFPEGEKYAREWFFLPLAPDPLRGGAINTRQRQNVYGQTAILARLKGATHVNWYGWHEFTPSRNAKHGVWISDELHDLHVARRRLRGYDEWTEHLPASELDENGRLLEQRAQGRYAKNLGTMTFYQRDTATHTVAYGNHNLDLATTTATQADITDTWTGTAGRQYTFTTASGVPGVTWPASTVGRYGLQVNIIAIGADMTSHSTDLAEFWEENSGLTNGDDWWQVGAWATGTGLMLMQNSGGGWRTSGTTTPFGQPNVNERIVVDYNVTNTNSMKSETWTVRVNTTDSFVDGPWTAAAGPATSLALPRGNQQQRRYQAGH